MLPNELKTSSNFIGWKMVGDKKLPMNIHTGSIGSSTDKACRGSYIEAKEATTKYGFTGIGFCFEEPWVGIDLDDCVVNGVLNDYAQKIVRAVNSYTELSPSGTGIHIICKGSIPYAVKKAEIEIYQTGRFFTLTERALYNGHRIAEIQFSSLLEFIPQDVPKQQKHTEASWIKEQLDNIKEGTRNNSFAAIAGLLRDKGFSKEDIFELLKPKAIELSFDLEELNGVCKSISRYQPTITQSSDDNSFLSFINDTQTVEWLIPDVLASNTINIIAGLQESRKSWLLIDLAIAFSSGVPWLGCYNVPKKKVMLIDQERPKAELQRRLTALISGRGLPLESFQGCLVPKTGTTYRMNLEQSFDAFSKLIIKERPDIVLIDSLKTFQSGDITNNQVMQDVFEKLKHIRNTFNITFVILHHENKGAYVRNREGNEVTAETIAGASSINEVPEGIFISVNHGPDSSILHHVKNSYGLKQAPIAFKITNLTEDRKNIAVEVI